MSTWGYVSNNVYFLVSVLGDLQNIDEPLEHVCRIRVVQKKLLKIWEQKQIRWIEKKLEE